MCATKLIFGAGYLGLRVARRWREEGCAVHLVTRRSDRADELRTAGFLPLVADVTKPRTLASLPAAETILFAVGHDRSARPDIRSAYAGGVGNVLASLPEPKCRFIYVSSTGVYGDADGGWVDETTPPDPQRAGGAASLAAEKVLQQHSAGRRAVVLRLAGIYGPGRIPYLDRIRAGEPIPAPSEGWLNLIHVDDAAEIVCAAARWSGAQQAADGPWTFCVSDGRPVLRAEYYREAARRIGAPEIQFVAPAADSPAAARARCNRRISQRKMIEQLAVHLSYPSYQYGLARVLKDEPRC